MSDVTYPRTIRVPDKPLVWLHGVVKSPPLSPASRLHAGVLLGPLQRGETLLMPAIGPRCHELRLRDAGGIWRIVYRVNVDAIVILDVFPKKSAKTPQRVLAACRQRLRAYHAP